MIRAASTWTPGCWAQAQTATVARRNMALPTRSLGTNLKTRESDDPKAYQGSAPPACRRRLATDEEQSAKELACWSLFVAL